MSKNQNGFTILPILIIAVVIGIVFAAGSIVSNREKNNTEDNQAAPLSTISSVSFDQMIDEIEQNDNLAMELFFKISYSNTINNADYLAGLADCISYEEKNVTIVNELAKKQNLSAEQQMDLNQAKSYTDLRLLYFKTARQGSIDNDPSTQQDLDEIALKIEALKN